MLSREGESQPGARGAWSYSEISSSFLLIWSIACAGLAFCLSSHLLRSVFLLVLRFFLTFSSFKGLLTSFSGPFDLYVFRTCYFSNKSFTVKPCLAESKWSFLVGHVLHTVRLHFAMHIQIISHVLSDLTFTCFLRVLLMHSKYRRALSNH